ncbi:tetratricopeptide repeat protein [Novipirellula aureliae]|uniref:Tetratricopeptide repeat protein n=1 Tax=Novipirellula aureliae TaxID=2527966 RepID=A0A5C6DYI4_9BACT|nr:tetratricopeptide repeat protein [Novipirellula aureliae]TWU41284.1 tetratricopeptide repeat protein [Novipirellula aureliae]
MKRVINSKLLLILTALAIGTVAAIAGLHHLQSGRSGALFLQEARKSVENDQVERALRSYRSHLRLQPDSTEGRRELASLLLAIGDFNGALEELETLLRVDESNQAARRDAASAAVSLGRYTDANEHLRRLANREADGELLLWEARCKQAANQYREAETAYRQSIEREPDRLETYFRLALLLTDELDQPDSADAVMDELITNNPTSSDAHLQVAQYLQSVSEKYRKEGHSSVAIEKSNDALRMASKAVSLDQTSLPALLLLASCEFQQKDTDLARKHVETAQKVDPTSPQTYLMLSDIETAVDRRRKAIDWLEQGIASVASNSGKQALLVRLANLQLDEKQLDKVPSSIEQLRFLKADPATIAYLEGRIAVINEAWDDAMLRLESARLAFVNSPDRLKKIDFLLGKSFQATHQFEQAVTAQRRAIGMDPQWVQPRLALVELYDLQGQPDDAYKELQELMRLPSAPAEGWTLLARRCVEQNYRLPNKERDWVTAVQFVERAETANPTSVEIALLRAEIYRAQGQIEKAESFLSETVSSMSNRESDDSGNFDTAMRTLSIAACKIAIEKQDWQQAEEILHRAEQDCPDDLLIMTFRATLLASRYRDQATKPLTELLADASVLSAQQQQELKLHVTRLALNINLMPLSKQLFHELVESGLKNEDVWTVGLQIANATNDSQLLSETLGQLKSAQGETGLWHLAESKQQIDLQTKSNQPNYDKALQHLADAEKQMPRSPAPLLMKADIALRQDDPKAAIESLTKAIERGDRSATTLRNSIVLLHRTGDYDRADELIHLIDDANLSRMDGLGRTASMVSANRNDYVRALMIARQTANVSSDYRDILWLGQLAARCSNREEFGLQRSALRGEAEAAFRQAVELSPAEPQPCLSLVALLVEEERKEDAVRLVDELQQSPLSKSNPLAMARMHELIGNSDRAKNVLENAVAEPPNDETMLRAAAEFFLRQNQHDDAEAMLQRLMELSSVSNDTLQWSRRQLALMKSGSGGEKSTDDAIKLVNLNLAANPESVPDLRTRAMILSSQLKSSGRSQAISSWRSLVAKREGVFPEDHFQLARLLVDTGNWLEASKEIRSAIALSTDPLNRARYIGQYIAWQAERNELPDAKLWLDRLEEMEGAEQIAARLRVEWLARNGDHEMAVRLMRDQSESVDAKNVVPLTRWMESVASLVSDNENEAYLSVVEQTLREASQQDRERRFDLARVLMERGEDPDSIIDLLEETTIQEDELNLAVPILDQLVRSSQLEKRQLERVEKKVGDWIASYGNSSQLEMVKASTRTAQGDHQKARDTYRAILSREPNNLVALNNLAVSLSEDDASLLEAVEFSNRSLAIAGRNPAVLDTRAVIELSRGNATKALELMKEATRVLGTNDPVYLLHRAIAYLRVGEKAKAIEDYQLALSNHLQVQNLGRRDQQWQIELEAAL